MVSDANPTHPPTEILRRAAALMRERAEAATPGPWEFRNADWPWVALYVDEATIPEGDSLPTVEPGGGATRADMAHIASWHPDVALAVADWLDDALDAHLHIRPGNYPSYIKALAVSRAYLGEPA